MVNTLYRPEMSVTFPGHRSPGPSKPSLFVGAVQEARITRPEPATPDELAAVHTDDYLRDLLSSGEGLASSAGFPWSRAYADSVLHTTGALRCAIDAALSDGEFHVAPVSGFHHAVPSSGMDFCAVSGQAAASVAVHRARGAVGAYFDLDAHYGNSIDDTYRFQPDLLRAVPRGMNVNPSGTTATSYAADLARAIARVRRRRPDYVVLCHGADTVAGDPLGCGVLSLNEWLDAGRAVARAFASTPTVYCLFGGYGRDAVDLHAAGARAAISARGTRT